MRKLYLTKLSAHFKSGLLIQCCSCSVWLIRSLTLCGVLLFISQVESEVGIDWLVMFAGWKLQSQLVRSQL